LSSQGPFRPREPRRATVAGSRADSRSGQSAPDASLLRNTSDEFADGPRRTARCTNGRCESGRAPTTAAPCRRRRRGADAASSRGSDDGGLGEP
jgi:hypothetical protein